MTSNSDVHLCFLGKLVMATMMLFMVGTNPVQAQSENHSVVSEYSKGDKQCLLCHAERSVRHSDENIMDSMSLATEQGLPVNDSEHHCESCHGPASAHTKLNLDGHQLPPPVSFAKSEPSAEKDAVCLTCHDDHSTINWIGSRHDIEGVSCVDCHDIHAGRDVVTELETQASVCYTCHQEQRSQFLRQSRHPVDTGTGLTSHTGLMSCSDCHTPHGSSTPGDLKQNTINESCYECHAEKRGPFLWEHQPVMEDCTSCHTAHGSNYEPLLTGRQPWLCQQCHLAFYHPSGAYSGTGKPPDGAVPSILAGQCISCHNQIHGSNHPSGLRLTR